MPAVSVSSQLSRAVYFFAILGLCVLLARPVYLVYSASQERAAEEVASGLGAMLDSMSPGTTVVATLERYPWVPLTVAFSGTTIVASYVDASATAQVRWDLPTVTLFAGQAYVFTLQGREIVVAQERHG